jgi:hypothetical protein
LGGGGTLGGQARAFGFEEEADFEELEEAIGLSWNEEGEGCGEGFLEFVDDFGASALADFEEALQFESFDGLTEDAATDAQLGCENAFGGEFLRGRRGGGVEAGSELGADLLDEGGGFGDGGEVLHGSVFNPLA